MHKIRLFLQVSSRPTTDESIAACALADGLAVPRSVDPGTLPCPPGGSLLLCGHQPATAIENCNAHPFVLVQDIGLDKLARHRDEWSELEWVPRIQVYRAPARFDFQTEYHGEGFKMYMPNLTTYRTYRVAREELELSAWLGRARDLGFTRAWLAGVDAEVAGNGLDLEMLEVARRHSDITLWLSGGATRTVHLRNLVREGGANGVVLPIGYAASEGIREVRSALTPALPVTMGDAGNTPTCGGGSGSACA